MVPIVEKETGVRQYHMIGESSGALRVAAFAAQYPERAGRLVFSAYTYTGKDSPTLTERAKNLDFYQKNNRRPRPKEMIESIFTRDKAGTSDRHGCCARRRRLQSATSFPPAYLDMTSQLRSSKRRHQISVLVIAPAFRYRDEADLLDSTPVPIRIPVRDVGAMRSRC